MPTENSKKKKYWLRLKVYNMGIKGPKHGVSISTGKCDQPELWGLRAFLHQFYVWESDLIGSISAGRREL